MNMVKDGKTDKVKTNKAKLPDEQRRAKGRSNARNTRS